MFIKISNGDQFQSFLWVVLGLVLGALVGIEREYRGHEAGMRTNALVCAGATLFAEMSSVFGDTRIASNVVQGVGFLGAGLVFQRGNNVKGVTTAATIWMMAAVGLMIGTHLWLAAILISVTVVGLLELFPISDYVLAHGSPHRVSRQSRERLEGDDPARPDDSPA
jgi:putative Mg2+ transporter-C (MgtC) family protein